MDQTIAEWHMYNDLQTTLANCDDHNADVQKYAEEVHSDCRKDRNCTLVDAMESVDVEQLVKVYLIDNGRKDKVSSNVYLVHTLPFYSFDFHVLLSVPIDWFWYFSRQSCGSRTYQL